ncbi:MAG: carbon-nitrogen hydrolase family protein [Pseudomonadota bacterium]
MTNIVALQFNGTSSPERNLSKIEDIIGANQSSISEHSLVVLPECAAVFGCSGKTMYRHAELVGDGPIQRAFAEMAKKYRIFLVAGSTPILPSADSPRFYATSILYGPDGDVLARYNKIHLFDVEVEDNTKSYRESSSTFHGSDVIKYTLPWTSLGMSICYDLRFSGLFNKLRPAKIVCVPSAFTQVTGNAHWHALLKARAIENQCYMVAANQVGEHDDGRLTYGNSCIYSPWGELLSCIKTEEGVAVSDYNEKLVDDIRKKMPVFDHCMEKYE